MCILQLQVTACDALTAWNENIIEMPLYLRLYMSAQKTCLELDLMIWEL